MLAPFGIRPKGTLLARMLPLAQALTQRGHAVTIIAPPVHNPEAAGTRIRYGAVPVVHTPAALGPGPLAVVQQSVALMHAALREQPDCLHLFKPKGYGGLAALAAAPLGLPLVLDTDDWEGPGGWNELLPYPTAARRLFAWQERDLPRRAAAVTVASRTLESLVWAMGVAPQRVFYLPNGVAVQPRAAAPIRAAATRGASAKLLLYTRFWELDLAELAAALAAVHSARPEARLIVVGQGEQGEEQHLLAWAERAGFRPLLDYRGWLAPEAIPEVLAEAAIALVPTRDTLINRARCSAKLLELMGAGLALVASDVGEARSFIRHEQHGLLVPPGDAGALAVACVRLLDDAPLRERLAQGAYMAATQSTWQRLALVAEAAYTLALPP
ncbi:glycosyl transferase family 1 [Candidatus Viridilinea mediisalina]|uniref:Glycosyl transferase family 1 n=2 Tax=Candidatus Viridilinea mediisalina TaxID=2024553 RepID=A0A2A6RI66_9CHLR|nr:glycosyl transferase family 1 [Candidatus Viridilinea mediisalina]